MRINQHRYSIIIITAQQLTHRTSTKLRLNLAALKQRSSSFDSIEVINSVIVAREETASKAYIDICILFDCISIVWIICGHVVVVIVSLPT